MTIPINVPYHKYTSDMDPHQARIQFSKRYGYEPLDVQLITSGPDIGLWLGPVRTPELESAPALEVQPYCGDNSEPLIIQRDTAWPVYRVTVVGAGRWFLWQGDPAHVRAELEAMHVPGQFTVEAER